MGIESLEKTDFDTLFRGYNLAFSDYPGARKSKEQLKVMLKRRGYNPELSFAMFDGGQILSFTLNGTGNFNGVPTVYDTGTATLIEHRGKGFASRVLEYSLPFLKKANYTQYLLEVLQHNEKALTIYKKTGFEVVRGFNYFVQKRDSVTNQIKNLDHPYSIKEIVITQYNSIPDFWDFHPSWQNSLESIQRAVEGYLCLGAFAADKLVGYCVFFPASGDIAQIAVDRGYRRKGIGSLLFSEILKLNKSESIKKINTDVLCESITAFFKSKNMDITGKQFEMVRKL